MTTNNSKTIDWLPTEGHTLEDETLVVLTGYNMGKPSRGRWIAVARYVAGAFYSDETGEECAEATHYHLPVYPA